MYDGHFIDDPLHVVNVKPDFSGLGMEPIHNNKGTMTDKHLQAQRERIGQRITDLRKSYEWTDNDNVKHTGLTQAQLAERCGLSQAHIARIEGGYYSVGFDKLQAIAEALDKNIDFI